MATTALLIPDPKVEGIKHKVKVVTTPIEGQLPGIQVDWFSCDEDWMPSGLLGNNVKEQDEMTFHMNLRRESRQKNTYVIEQSTNPELNVYLDAEREQSLGE